MACRGEGKWMWRGLESGSCMEKMSCQDSDVFGNEPNDSNEPFKVSHLRMMYWYVKSSSTDKTFQIIPDTSLSGIRGRVPLGSLMKSWHFRSQKIPTTIQLALFRVVLCVFKLNKPIEDCFVWFEEICLQSYKVGWISTLQWRMWGSE